MFPHRMVVSVAIVLGLAASSAHAFFDPPWITPNTPRAGETVSVNIRGGICDSIFFSPGYPEITQQDNAIRLLEYGHHWDTQDLCIYDIGVLSEPLGAYAPGDYTLTVEMIYDDFLYGPTIMTVGVVPFTVTGATTAAPVPGTGVFGRLALVLVISSSALWVFRTRRRINRR